MGIFNKSYDAIEKVMAECGVSQADDITTVIDEGMVLDGGLQGSNGRGIAVFGTTKGLIDCDGVVFVAPGAKALGGIRAHVIIAAGEVSGEEVLARACLQVRSKGLVKSTRIAYGELEFERGGRIEGGLSPVEMDETVRKWDEERAKAVPMMAPRAQTNAGASAATILAQPTQSAAVVQPFGKPAQSLPSSANLAASSGLTVAPEALVSKTEAAAAAMAAARPLPAI